MTGSDPDSGEGDCKMLSAAGVLETDEPQRASVSTRLPLPSSDFALLTAFV
jgi:hypothetical protein